MYITVMLANLPPECLETERKCRQTAGDDERLAGLQKLPKDIPKHKGTETIQADLKTRMARLKKEVLRDMDIVELRT